MLRKKRLIGIAVAAMILAVAIAGVAMATDQQADPDKANHYQAFIAKLAANLGVDQDKVNNALDATKKQMLDEAVADGRLTQEQADRMAAREGGFMGWFGGMHDRKNMFGERLGKNSAAMAEAIGITEEQLKSELESGKKLSDILADHGLTEEQFQQKMLEIRKEALAQAVADGKLTQEQADKIAAGMDGKMGWFGGMKDGIGIFGGRMGKNVADMAKAMGITEDQLKSEIESGKKLPDILADHGLTEDQFHQKMLQIKKEALAQAVADGKLTQDQADKMLQRMEQLHLNAPSNATDN